MKYVKHPIAIFLFGALALYIIQSLFSGSWNPFATAVPAGKTPVLDANGKPTGRYVNSPSSSSARSIGCCAVGNIGFIGNCKFPITKNDNVPPCASI